MATLCLARIAWAEGSVTVKADGCGALDVAEIERLVALDLANVIEERKGVRFPPVQIACGDGSMRIVVDDPVTAKKLERELPLPNAKGRERTMALAISQLFLTSWTELLLPPPPKPVGPPPQAQGATAARAIAKKTVAPAVSRVTGELGLFGGAHGRDLAHTWIALASSLRAGVVIDQRFHLFALGGFETGSASRGLGSVEVSLATVGVGVGWRAPRRGVLSFDAALTGSLAYARIDGRANEGFVGAGGTGTGVDLAALLGPAFVFGAVRIGLELHGGVTFPQLVGDVRGDAPVRASGPWIGGGASLAIALGGG